MTSLRADSTIGLSVSAAVVAVVLLGTRSRSELYRFDLVG